MADKKTPKPLKSLYLVHGEEELLRIEKVDEIRENARFQGYLRERFTVDSANFDWSEIVAQANSVGMFSDLKLLEIDIPNGKLGKQGADIIQQFAENPLPDTSILIVMPKLEKAQTQSKWFNSLAQSKQSEIIECKAIGLNGLPQWIIQRLKQHGLTIENDALALFVQRVEGNLLAAKQEIDKLALLHPSGYCVNMADTEQAVANVARFDVFQLSAAWWNGDLKRVIHLLDGLQAEGDEPVLLLWAIAEDIRTLIRLKAFLKQGKTIASVRAELRLWGEKQNLAPKAVQRISVNRLISALQECAKIDRQIKGAENGDAWTSLKHLMMNLAV